MHACMFSAFVLVAYTHTHGGCVCIYVWKRIYPIVTDRYMLRYTCNLYSSTFCMNVCMPLYGDACKHACIAPCMYTDRDRQTETDRQRQTDRQTDSRTDRGTCKQGYPLHPFVCTDRGKDRQADLRLSLDPAYEGVLSLLF